ncbi:MAG: hypothetical protein MZV64_10400 [Ignavibacteriales bacterium]|nr:hypothetical protein [Ignavibacteriales bacterium]
MQTDEPDLTEAQAVALWLAQGYRFAVAGHATESAEKQPESTPGHGGRRPGAGPQVQGGAAESGPLCRSGPRPRPRTRPTRRR